MIKFLLDFLFSLFARQGAAEQPVPAQPAPPKPVQPPAHKINDAGLEIIKSCEGCKLDAYQDVVGVWTIGYGHTPAQPGQVINQMQADMLLRSDLAKFEAGVADEIGSAPTTGNQFSALVSLAYNIGLAHEHTSTVLRKHLDGDYQGAADAFLMWDKAGGTVYRGLLARRQRERALYLEG